MAGFDWPLGGFCDKDLATLSQREAAGRTSYGSVGSIIVITQKSSRGRQKLRTIALKHPLFENVTECNSYIFMYVRGGDAGD